MGSQKDSRLEPLDDSETWRLFQVMAGDVVKDRSLQGTANQVANKCAGLPILIVTVSGTLKGKGIHAWKDALNRLRRVDYKDIRGIYSSALELVTAVHQDHFVVVRIHKLPERLENPKLRLLSLTIIYSNNHSMEIPDSFFEGVPNLKVLDLRCMKISSLPLSLSSLTKLKTLCLDRCASGGIAALGAMKNIDILRLCKSSITKFPTEIRQLIRLRMLDLRCFVIKLIPLNIIPSLINLEEFYAGDTFIRWEAETATKQNKNASVAELSQLFQKPNVIKVKRCDRLQNLISSLMVRWLPQLLEIEVSECNFMKEIVVAENFITGDNDKTNVIEFYQLCSLTLCHLPALCELYSNELKSSKSKPLFKVAFLNLETLKLSSINLKKIWDDSQFLSTYYVQNLTSLIVGGCGNIKYLFLSFTVGSFSKLKLLEISNCHVMDEIVVAEEGRNNAVHSAEVQIFPKLEKMAINGMKKLEDNMAPTIREFENNRGLPIDLPMTLLRLTDVKDDLKKHVTITKWPKMPKINEQESTESELKLQNPIFYGCRCLEECIGVMEIFLSGVNVTLPLRQYVLQGSGNF
ncbi:hypothetical protein L6164_002690 [Bauhinia variegata]|uniref:Uncharacterized protein n=1 Tax=Bauhinia variegata TaxID=167791 RepID=A0ACB9Q138_BAUVA|nr:hypothetical protein L6164_002690 [Bauhinia variegata]